MPRCLLRFTLLVPTARFSILDLLPHNTDDALWRCFFSRKWEMNRLHSVSHLLPDIGKKGSWGLEGSYCLPSSMTDADHQLTNRPLSIACRPPETIPLIQVTVRSSLLPSEKLSAREVRRRLEAHQSVNLLGFDDTDMSGKLCLHHVTSGKPVEAAMSLTATAPGPFFRHRIGLPFCTAPSLTHRKIHANVHHHDRAVKERSPRSRCPVVS